MGYAPQRRDQIRPSEHARNRAASALREHYAAGRFDEVELERRVELAYAATSRSDLKALFRDLPWDPRSRDRRDGWWLFQRNLFRAHGVAYVGINGMLVGIWAATGQGEFWPAESIAGWGAFLGGHWAILRAAMPARARRRSASAGSLRRATASARQLGRPRT